MFEEIMFIVGILTTIVVTVSSLVLGGTWLWENWATRQSKINEMELRVLDKRLVRIESKLGNLENKLREVSDDIHK